MSSDLLPVPTETPEAAERKAKILERRKKAEALRAMGEKLIREDYSQQAAALAETLGKLCAIELYIAVVNRRIERLDDDAITPVDSPNRIRCIPWRERTVRVTRDVAIGHPAHPYHAGKNVVWGHDPEYIARHQCYEGDAPWIRLDKNTRKPVPELVTVEVEETLFEHGESQQDLCDAIRLPPVEVGGAHFWCNKLSDEEVDAITASLLQGVDQCTA